MAHAMTGLVAAGQRLGTKANSMNKQRLKTIRPTLFALVALVGLTIVSTATAQLEPRGYYNVLTFGAPSDGQTMCTEAIHKAIDKAASAGGGIRKRISHSAL